MLLTKRNGHLVVLANACTIHPVDTAPEIRIGRHVYVATVAARTVFPIVGRLPISVSFHCS